ncbi:MAG TPA: chloride channel protein [Candidatus Limnocylindrales bacterium]
MPEDLPGPGGQTPTERGLGDFTMGVDALRLIPLALAVGLIASGIALVLLDMIGLVTNLCYYGRLDLRLTSPAANHLGPLSAVIPVVGGLIVGLMARYGSERIRGHGIPEAMETILVGGSRVEPRLAILKPISSAISIGTGGPFGAEGPIILTGGAFGSLVGQFVHLSAAERKTLLVAGAAAGMTAVFATPIASTLLAVELLLFEWKPRSLVPVAAASALAAAVRIAFADAGLLAQAPLFPVPPHPILGPAGLAGALALGLVCGLVAWLLTVAVYGAEDGFKSVFHRLGVHWMWWPAIGGLIVGLGGLVDPRSLGVGYDSIRAELAGQLLPAALLTLFVVKLAVWALALGSGTSGGILAPLLLMGGAVGGLLAPVLPGGSIAIWGLVGMAGALAGVTRSPFTGVIFAFELTHDQNALLPLLIACVAADAISVLALRRSILTEKVARRGFHVMREYQVDPLEALFVRDVMATSVLTFRADQPAAEVQALFRSPASPRGQRLYPVLDGTGGLVGVVGRTELLRALGEPDSAPPSVADLMLTRMTVAYPDETLRSVADRMAAERVGMMPVVERTDPGRLRGLVSQFDLLRARARLLEEERHRERVLRVRLAPVLRFGRRAEPVSPSVDPGPDDEAAAGA